MLYVDTSAFLKLVIDEEHSAQLRDSFAGKDLWSSSLLDIEAHRAARRLGVPVSDVDEHLDVLTIFTLSEATFAAARSVGSDALRTLDALHLAAALELAGELEAVVTYDRRLALGCEDVGCPVLTPGLAASWWIAMP